MQIRFSPRRLIYAHFCLRIKIPAQTNPYLWSQRSRMLFLRSAEATRPVWGTLPRVLRLPLGPLLASTFTASRAPLSGTLNFSSFLCYFFLMLPSFGKAISITIHLYIFFTTMSMMGSHPHLAHLYLEVLQELSAVILNHPEGQLSF